MSTFSKRVWLAGAAVAVLGLAVVRYAFPPASAGVPAGGRCKASEVGCTAAVTDEGLIERLQQLGYLEEDAPVNG